jgi:hypothetical protein
MRSDYQFQFAQGYAAGSAGKHSEARRLFRSALAIYKLCKPRQLIWEAAGANSAGNPFRTFFKEDEHNYLENAKKELQNELY